MGSRKLNNNSNIIGKNLKKYRQLNNLSQEGLCNKMSLIGVPMFKIDIYEIEHNKRLVKDFELKGFCIVFNISAEELLADTEVFFD